jgi:hypothetical protein
MVQSILDALDGDEDSSEGVWIDERCIRQADDEDKINAIAAMDIIYEVLAKWSFCSRMSRSRPMNRASLPGGMRRHIQQRETRKV